MRARIASTRACFSAPAAARVMLVERQRSATARAVGVIAGQHRHADAVRRSSSIVSRAVSRKRIGDGDGAEQASDRRRRRQRVSVAPERFDRHPRGTSMRPHQRSIADDDVPAADARLGASPGCRHEAGGREASDASSCARVRRSRARSGVPIALRRPRHSEGRLARRSPPVDHLGDRAARRGSACRSCRTRPRGRRRAARGARRP